MNDTSADSQQLTERLSRALNRSFALDGAGNAATRLADAPLTMAYGKRLQQLGLPARAEGSAVNVDMVALREAIREAGGDDAFFDKLAEDAKATQANAQPIENRDDQPAQPAEPPQKARDQEQEKLLALAEGLQEDGVAVKFREGLMQRIELQQKYEPGFDRGKALGEANRLIKAVNKSHAVAVHGAKKRGEVAAARVERTLDERETQPQMVLAQALELERVKAEVAAEKAEAMDRAMKAFMRGNATPMGVGAGLFGQEKPIMVNAPQLAAPAVVGPELSGELMEQGIARTMAQLGLRDASIGGFAASTDMPMAAMTPMRSRSNDRVLAA